MIARHLPLGRSSHHHPNFEWRGDTCEVLEINSRSGFKQRKRHFRKGCRPFPCLMIKYFSTILSMLSTTIVARASPQRVNKTKGIKDIFMYYFNFSINAILSIVGPYLKHVVWSHFFNCFKQILRTLFAIFIFPK